MTSFHFSLAFIRPVNPPHPPPPHSDATQETGSTDRQTPIRFVLFLSSANRLERFRQAIVYRQSPDWLLSFSALSIVARSSPPVSFSTIPRPASKLQVVFILLVCVAASFFIFLPSSLLSHLHRFYSPGTAGGVNAQTPFHLFFDHA